MSTHPNPNRLARDASLRAVLQAALIAALLAAPIAAQPAAANSAEDPPPGTELSLWKDPNFRKEFVGSFGINSDIEPRVDQVDQETLKELLDLLDPEAPAEDQAKGEQRLAEILAEEGSNAIFDFMLGNLHFQRDELDQAAVRYETAIAKFAPFRRAWKNLGFIRVRQEDYAGAIQPLSKVIQLGGGDGLLYGLLGVAYSATGQYLSAESAYRSALLLQPDSKDWKLGLTQAVFKQQKYGETVALTEELLAGDPERADYWILQANAWIGLDEPLKAAENFELLHRMGKAKPPVLFTLGDIYVNRSLWSLAARAYESALAARKEGGDCGESLRRVEVLAQRGANAEARGLLGAVQRACGADLAADERKKLLKLEARMAVAEGAGGDAVEALVEVVEIDPLDGEALMLLGQHYSGADEPERAIFYYERAESLPEFEADAKVRHAQVLVGLGRYGEALPLLEAAQDLKPRDDVARYLEQVERIARARR